MHGYPHESFSLYPFRPFKIGVVKNHDIKATLRRQIYGDKINHMIAYNGIFFSWKCTEPNQNKATNIISKYAHQKTHIQSIEFISVCIACKGAKIQALINNVFLFCVS